LNFSTNAFILRSGDTIQGQADRLKRLYVYIYIFFYIYTYTYIKLYNYMT